GGRLRIEMKRVEAVAAAEVENASLAWQELARIHAALEEVRTPFFRETEQIGTVVEPFGGVVQPPAAVGVPAVERAEIALSDAHGRLVVEVVADGLAGRLALRTEPRSITSELTQRERGGRVELSCDHGSRSLSSVRGGRPSQRSRRSSSPSFFRSRYCRRSG